MIRALQRLVVLAGALAAGGACTVERTCPDDWCGTLVAVSTAEPDVLLPNVSQGNVGRELGELLFDKLADIGPDMNTVGDGGFVPELARSWVFQDSLTISFTLNPRARWHDGTPVTAHDVAFTYETFRDPAAGSPAAPRLTRLASVTARDSVTAVFRFREAYPEQFFDAVYHLWIVPRHLLDGVPREAIPSHAFGRTPVGSGPFRFARWSASEFVELAANPAYHLGRPGVRRAIWRFTTDPQTALTQLLAGEVDLHQALLRPEDVERAQRTPQLRAISYAVPVYTYLLFNLRDPADRRRPHPLFADRELRRALTMAVDREAVVRAVSGDFGVVPPGPVTRPLWIWSDTLRAIPFDSAAARRRLAELGWRDTDGDGVLDHGRARLAFDFLVPGSSAMRVRAAQVIQDQLRRVGVELRVVEMEFRAWSDRMDAGRFDAVFGARQQDPSPASILEAWTTAGPANAGRYTNPTVDRLIADAVRAREVERARALWHEALALIGADAPAIWVYEPTVYAAVHTRFRNVTIRPDMLTATVWTWRVDPARMLARDRVTRD